MVEIRDEVVGRGWGGLGLELRLRESTYLKVQEGSWRTSDRD